MGRVDFALAQLRHLYAQMLDGRVVLVAEAARGLLGPAIETLEQEMGRHGEAIRRVWLLWHEYSSTERLLVGVFATEADTLAERDRIVGGDCDARMEEFIVEDHVVMSIALEDDRG